MARAMKSVSCKVFVWVLGLVLNQSSAFFKVVSNRIKIRHALNLEQLNANTKKHVDSGTAAGT